MAKPGSHQWSATQDALLSQLWQERGLNSIQITERISAIGTPKSPSQVYARRHYLGLPPRPRGGFANVQGKKGEIRVWTQAQMDVLVREWAKGTRAALIAVMTGHTLKQVIWKREYMKLPERRSTRHRAALVKVSVYIPKPVDDKLKDVVRQLDMSRSAYVNKLILREIRVA